MKVYLDNNATTPLDPRVLEAVLPFFGEFYGNPSSMHTFGRDVQAHIDDAREKIAGLLGGCENEIIFTGSGSEADNAALKGAVAASDKKHPHIITGVIEHPAIFNTAKALERNGVRVTFLPVGREGVVDPDDARKAIDGNTVLVSIMHVNNETGAIQPVEEIAKICAEKEVLFHADAVQSVGRIPVNFSEIGADMASVAGHKFNGPKGIGFLYVRTGTRIRPLIDGGKQEEGRRAGTHNSPGIIGMARALELSIEELPATMERVARLRDRFESAILSKVPDCSVNGGGVRRVPNTSNIAFRGVEAEALLIKLDMEGIAVSAGSACSTGSASSSHVLLAMGLTDREASSSIRFSFGKFNTEAEIDYVTDVVPRAVEQLRAIAARA